MQIHRPIQAYIVANIVKFGSSPPAVKAKEGRYGQLHSSYYQMRRNILVPQGKRMYFSCTNFSRKSGWWGLIWKMLSDVLHTKLNWSPTSKASVSSLETKGTTLKCNPVQAICKPKYEASILLTWVEALTECLTFRQLFCEGWTIDSLILPFQWR